MKENMNAYTRTAMRWIADNETLHGKIIAEANSAADQYHDHEDIADHMAEYIRRQVEEKTAGLSNIKADLISLAIENIDYAELAEIFLNEAEAEKQSENRSKRILIYITPTMGDMLKECMYQEHARSVNDIINRAISNYLDEHMRQENTDK